MHSLLLQNLAFDFAVSLAGLCMYTLARQLSMLEIIQAAWIQTFAHFMPCLSIRAAGKLLTKVLPTSGCYKDLFKMQNILV